MDNSDNKKYYAENNKSKADEDDCNADETAV